MAKGRLPDFDLRAINRESDERSRKLGAGWVNADGSISIKVDPFIILNGGKNLILTLFPYNSEYKNKTSADDVPDDVPF